MTDNNGKPPVVHIATVDVSLIPMSETFKKKPLIEQFNYMHKLASSNNHALDLMQKERDQAVKKQEEYKKLAENADIAVQQQKQIVIETLTIHAEKEQEMADRIKQLEAELQEFNQLKRLIKKWIK